MEPIKSKREGFFSSDNLHRAGWAALIGLFGFLGALTYNKIFGPQKVVVESAPPAATQIITESQPSSKEITALANAILKLTAATSNNANQKRLQELTNEVDRLRTIVNQAGEVSQQQKPSVNANLLINPTSASPTPNFTLPEAAHGYTSEKIFGISSSTCPAKTIAQGHDIRVTFNLVDPSLLSRASPMRASIVHVRSQTNYLQISELWNEMQRGTNTIVMSPQLAPGNYLLIYGFYLRNNITGKFPPFYSRTCSFVVPNQ